MYERNVLMSSENIYLMSNTLTWLWMGFIMTRQVVIISWFCIVFFHKSCKSSALPFCSTSSTNAFLSSQATTKLPCSLVITTIILLIFFWARERAELNKSCNLIDSCSGRNFLIRTATAGGIRRVDLQSTIFVNELSVIVILSPFSDFHTRLIKASLSLFTLKWQGKSL